MAIYNHVLLALDLHAGCDEAVIKQALETVQENNAKLTIVHAIEHINAYGVAQAYPAVLELEQEMLKQAKDELAKICNKYQINNVEQIIEIGSPKLVVLDTAKKVGADLILVGSHGRHGLGVLLGSTANAILHHAPCDVLAVRVK